MTVLSQLLQPLRGRGYAEYLQRKRARATSQFVSLRGQVRSLRDLGLVGRAHFRRLRRTDEYQAVFELDEPLVSICIPTYNRSRLLLTRSVTSALRQTYRNVEVIVVGDCCTDDTAEVMAGVRDDRFKFVNLPVRGNYPSERQKMWLVAGMTPSNVAMEMARGAFITQLDHDDEFTPDKIEKLVTLAKRARADVVYHPYLYEIPTGEWFVNEAPRFELGFVTASSVFYHRGLQLVPNDPLCYRYGEPGDWNRCRKFRYVGARIRRQPDNLLVHYQEGLAHGLVEGPQPVKEGHRRARPDEVESLEGWSAANLRVGR